MTPEYTIVTDAQRTTQLSITLADGQFTIGPATEAEGIRLGGHGDYLAIGDGGTALEMRGTPDRVPFIGFLSKAQLAALEAAE